MNNARCPAAVTDVLRIVAEYERTCFADYHRIGDGPSTAGSAKIRWQNSSQMLAETLTWVRPIIERCTAKVDPLSSEERA